MGEPNNITNDRSNLNFNTVISKHVMLATNIYSTVVLIGDPMIYIFLIVSYATASQIRFMLFCVQVDYIPTPYYACSIFDKCTISSNLI